MVGYHKPVLLRETVEALNIKKGNWYLDLTVGDGGHSLEILKLGGKVVGIDVDPAALERANERLQKIGYSGQFRLIQGNFRDINSLIAQQAELERQKFAGAIFDLGVSSLQLEDPVRGFSFSKEGPLDMRMDPNLEVRAMDLINVLSRKELYGLFKNLGEEKYSKRLADTLVSTREVKLTTELAELVKRKVGGGRGKIHPATKVFQALRIAVNDELGALQEGLEKIKTLIARNGRIVVLSFHSLEDRIVKNAFSRWQSMGLGEVLTKKPITPGAVEIKTNPRARSAKMRVFKII